MTSTWFGFRFMKEARPLLWPWCLALLASLAALNPGGEFVESARIFCFCGAVALFAALAYGAEFQQRTLALIFSQPVERSRVWAEKFWVVAAGAGLIVVLDCRTWLWLAHFDLWDLAGLWLVLVAIGTAAGLGIALTGSSAAGVTCGVLGQVLTFGATPFALRILYKHFPVQVASLLAEQKPLLLAVLSVYAFSFVWFGRGFWKSRLRGLALGMGASALALCIGRGLVMLVPDTVANSATFSFEAIFVVVTVCSAGFWSLTARSTVGGLVFCVGSQVLSALVFAFAMTKVAATASPEVRDGIVAGGIGIGVLVYAGLFLWLSWRKFAGMELQDAVFGEGFQMPGSPGRRGPWLSWLACRADSNLGNLFRKELRLQKPVFQTAAVFSVCWSVVWVLQLCWPERAYQPFLEMLPSFYGPVVLLLAGCVSVGDEKALGVAVWQLALPVSARKVWCVKAVVVSITGLALGLGLPGLVLRLAEATNTLVHASNGPHPEVIAGIVGGGWVVVLLGLWASTLVSTVVRAALTTIVALGVSAGCVALGTWMGQTLVTEGVQTGLLTWVLTHKHLSPDSLTNSALRAAGVGVLLVSAAWIFLLLREGLEQFRHTDLRRGRLLARCGVLAAILVLCPLWVTDLLVSAKNAPAEPLAALEEAVLRLPMAKVGSDGQLGVFSLADLEATEALPENTRTWLKGSSITCQASIVQQRRNDAEKAFQNRYGLGERTWFVSITFPGGGHFWLNLPAGRP